MSTTSIEWTEVTWNPVVGCTRVSPGCDNCYAVRQSFRNGEMGHAKYKGLTVLNGRGDRHFNGVVRTVEEALTIPLKRKKPTTYFVNSMSDLFHRDVPFAFVDRVFAVMALTPQHTYQVLTKRPERMEEYFATFEADFYEGKAEIDGEDGGYRLGAAAASLLDGPWIWNEGKPHRRRIEEFIADAHADPCGMSDFDEESDDEYECKPVIWPLPNVWLGTSIEDQTRADERIPHLLKCPAAVHFLSCEPLLGPLELSGKDLGGTLWIGGQRGCGGTHRGDGSPGCPREPHHHHDHRCQKGIDWVIVGGESGTGARPCNVEWIRSIVSQCKAADVPVFVKQLGARPFVTRNGRPFGPPHNQTVEGSVFLKKKGGDPSEWPEDLRVRQMPTGQTAPIPQ